MVSKIVLIVRYDCFLIRFDVLGLSNGKCIVRYGIGLRLGSYLQVKTISPFKPRILERKLILQKQIVFQHTPILKHTDFFTWTLGTDKP